MGREEERKREEERRKGEKRRPFRRESPPLLTLLKNEDMVAVDAARRPALFTGVEREKEREGEEGGGRKDKGERGGESEKKARKKGGRRWVAAACAAAVGGSRCTDARARAGTGLHSAGKGAGESDGGEGIEGWNKKKRETGFVLFQLSLSISLLSLCCLRETAFSNAVLHSAQAAAALRQSSAADAALLPAVRCCLAPTVSLSLCDLFLPPPLSLSLPLTPAAAAASPPL